MLLLNTTAIGWRTVLACLDSNPSLLGSLDYTANFLQVVSKTGWTYDSTSANTRKKGCNF